MLPPHPGFLDQALAVQQAVLYTDAVFTEANAPSAGDDDLDELTVLALMASSGWIIPWC